MIKFVQLADIDIRGVKPRYFVTGYQGFGLVGYLTTRHLVQELKMRRVGFIQTRYMPEVTLFKSGIGLQYPFEVYVGDSVIALLNNAIPHERERTAYVEFVIELIKEAGVEEILLVGGLDSNLRESENETYRWIPIGETKIKLPGRILEERHVIGPLALTMMLAEAHGLSGATILPFTEMYRPDPKASAVAVEVISGLLGMSIDTSKLLEEASLIEAIEAERKKIEEMLEGEKKQKLTYI